MNIYKLSIVSPLNVDDVFVVAPTLADAVAGYCLHNVGTDVRAVALIGECAAIITDDDDEDDWGSSAGEQEPS